MWTGKHNYSQEVVDHYHLVTPGGHRSTTEEAVWKPLTHSARCDKAEHSKASARYFKMQPPFQPSISVGGLY